ncbi:hypothetical protein [Nocardiopsis sp. RV163]|nr:hypothetical protein [Nocardiopsis sp. RV163]
MLSAQAYYEVFGAPGWAGYGVRVVYRHDPAAMDSAKAVGGMLDSRH